jgi:hypothetical protein
MAGYTALVGILMMLAGAVLPPLAVLGFLIFLIGAVSGLLDLIDRVLHRGSYKRP